MLTGNKKQIADALFKIGAVKFGAFRLKIHDTNPRAPLSPFYIDLRLLRSFPDAKKKAVGAYLKILRKLNFNLLGDIPTAATPLVSSISDAIGVGMITPRMDKKAHGTGAKIDGVYKKGQKVVVVDDLVTHARSKIEAINVLRKAGLKVKDVLVLVDREQGGREDLAKAGHRLHTVLGIHELFSYYADARKITKKKYKEILNYLNG